MNLLIFIVVQKVKRVLKVCNEKINYHSFITSLQNEECNNALLEVFNKINLDKIYDVIENTPLISDIRKRFYKEILTMRYEMILKVVYDKLTDK